MGSKLSIARQSTWSMTGLVSVLWNGVKTKSFNTIKIFRKKKRGGIRNIQDNAITVGHIWVQNTQFTYFNELCNSVSRLLIAKPVHGCSSVLDSYKRNMITFILKRQPSFRKYFVFCTKLTLRTYPRISFVTQPPGFWLHRRHCPWRNIGLR